MSKRIKLNINDNTIYDGELKIIKDLYFFDKYVFDKTIKRLISKEKTKETIVDIDKRLITINERGNTIDLPLSLNYYIEKEEKVEFEYFLDKECFNIKIEVGDMDE